MMSSSGARVIGTFSYKDGQFVSVDKNRSDFNSGLPIEIPIDQIHKYYPLKSDPEVSVGNLMNNIQLKPGKTYETPNDRRIIIKVVKTYVIFASVKDAKTRPSLYIQTLGGFHQEWLGTMQLSAAKRTASAVVLAEWEVQFLIGVLAGSSWAGLGSVIAGDVLEEAVTKKKSKSIKESVRMIQVLLSSRRELKLIAPELTSVLTEIIGLSLLKGQAQHLGPAMLSDPKVAGRIAGTLTAKLGKNALEKRLTTSALLWTVLSQVGIKAATTVPAAISDTIESFTPEESSKVIDKISEIINTTDIVVSEEEKKTIAREIENNPDKISRVFSKMLKDLKTPPR